MQKEIIDITLPLSENTPPFPGDPPLRIQKLFDFSNGDDLRLSAISLSAHLGTHLDAPLHFDVGGISIDQIDPDILIGEALVVELLTDDIIPPQALEPFLSPFCERILIKTSRALHLFPRPTAFLSADTAEMLVASGVRLIGIDSPSVDYTADTDAPVHKILLNSGILIVENLVLNTVEQMIAELICLPLKIIGIEGSPVRAVLRV